MCDILIDKVYTDGVRDVVPFDIDTERATIIYDVIAGKNKGHSEICSLPAFRKNYKEV